MMCAFRLQKLGLPLNQKTIMVGFTVLKNSKDHYTISEKFGVSQLSNNQNQSLLLFLLLFSGQNFLFSYRLFLLHSSCQFFNFSPFLRSLFSFLMQDTHKTLSVFFSVFLLSSQPILLFLSLLLLISGIPSFKRQQASATESHKKRHQILKRKENQKTQLYPISTLPRLLVSCQTFFGAYLDRTVNRFQVKFGPSGLSNSSFKILAKGC